MENKVIKARCELVDNNGLKELVLYGPVVNGKAWYLDSDEYICPQNVIAALKEADGEDILVRINTNGGDVFAGISIYNILKDYKGKVTVKVDGMAASAGSVIAIAGDKILMGVGTMLMIHNAWTFAAGNADELRKVADDLDKISDSISNIYMTRFSGTIEELKALLNAESYLTAEESIALGLADEEIEEEPAEPTEPKEPEEDPEEIKNSIIGKYIAMRKESDKAQSKGSFYMNKFR